MNTFTTQQAERNLRLYYWFQLFKEPLFWGPILITFINRVSGMTMSDIYFMESVCVIGIILLNAPFGALADVIGRKWTVAIGSCLLLADLIMFASATNPLMVWSANILWVFGASLISGADTSLLVDTLKFLNRFDEFQKIEGRSSAYRLALTAICSIFVGYIAEFSLRLPVYAGAPFVLISVIAAFLMKDPPISNKERKTFKDYISLLKLSALFVYNHKQIKWIIALGALITGISKVWFFTYNPYFELVDLPLRYFGWIFFALNITAAIASHEAKRLSKLLGDYGSVIMMISLIALPILVMGVFVAKATALLVLSQNVVRGFMTPFLGHFLQKHLDNANRATVTSIKATANSVAEFLLLGLAAIGMKIFNLATCLQILGMTMLVFGIVLIFTYRKVFPK